MWKFLVFAACVAVVVTVALGCDTTPDWPSAGEFGWASYHNQIAGYEVRYPDVCTIDDKAGGSTLFRFRGHPIVQINFVDELEARRRGLWVEHDPTGSIELDGRQGERYVYSHCDGPFCMNTVSWVIPYRGKFLAMEFRMRGRELSAVQRDMAGSLGLEF